MFLIDSRRPSTTSDDHQPTHDGVTAMRRLNDGREFRIYKLYYEPAALSVKLVELGWRADVHATETYFVYGEATRAS